MTKYSPTVFGAAPAWFPKSVLTHPGQQQLMKNAGFERARAIVIAFSAALLTK
jgi:hypothetical protein